MRITRIYTGEDQRSHFEEIDVPVDAEQMGPHATRLSALFANQGFSLHEPPPGLVSDFYNAPRRQIFIPLTGRVEMEVGDGTKRQFGPGDIVFADDGSGEGHKTREIEGPRQSIFIVLEDDFDVEQLRGR